MKFKYIFVILIITILIGGLAYYLFTHNNPSNKKISKNENNIDNYNTSRVEFSQNISQDNTSNISVESQNNNTSTSNPSNDEKNTSSFEQNSAQKPSSDRQETEIASFSTRIYTKDSERQKNVSITCNTLNDTIVENGKTFSFCNTVGKATSTKGYQKADVFKNGEKIKALGGGNCQVSSTLYNAVLKISELKVTERHAHSNDVPYVKKGKDAAVSYGTYDFKFVNNTRK